jgi:hypothetical protein
VTNPVTGEPTDPRPGGGPEHPFQDPYPPVPPPPPPAAEPDEPDEPDEQDEPDDESQSGGSKPGRAGSDR